MTRPRFTLLLASVGLLVASQPVLAATKKADARKAEVVAALLAVSPDPLGGRLGLAAATAQVPANARAKSDLAVTLAVANADQRAYAQWKGGTKS